VDHLLKGSALDSPSESRQIQVEAFLNASMSLQSKFSSIERSGYFCTNKTKKEEQKKKTQETKATLFDDSKEENLFS